jgi:hypothetical protein
MSEERDLGKILENLRGAFDQLDADMEKMADECDPEIKLAVTKWVFRKLIEHAQEGGTYRYLIYDRLGFGSEAYAPLCSDGMTISNEFDLNLKKQLREVAKTEGYDKIKPIVGLCDEPGCYNYISCGWPSDDGYRQTCVKHYIKLEK